MRSDSSYMSRLSNQPWSPRKNPWSLVYTTIGVVGDTDGLEMVEDRIDPLIDRGDHPQVVLDVALVPPPSSASASSPSGTGAFRS